LEPVVDRLGDAKERLIAADELPVGREPEIVEERDLGAEDLGDTATERRRAHVHHAATPERHCELAEERDHLTAGASAVAVDGLRADIDALEHPHPRRPGHRAGSRR
jgi:hypothetical protein